MSGYQNCRCPDCDNADYRAEHTNSFPDQYTDQNASRNEIDRGSRTSIDRPYLKPFIPGPDRAGSPLRTIPLTNAIVNSPVKPLSNCASGKPFKHSPKDQRLYNAKDVEECEPAGQLKYSKVDYKSAVMYLIWTSGILSSTNQFEISESSKTVIEERIFRILTMCQMTKDKFNFQREIASASSGLISLTHKPRVDTREILGVCLDTLNVLYHLFPDGILRSYLLGMGVQVTQQPKPRAYTIETFDTPVTSVRRTEPSLISSRIDYDTPGSPISYRVYSDAENCDFSSLENVLEPKITKLRNHKNKFQKRLYEIADKIGEIVSCHRNACRDE